MKTITALTLIALALVFLILVVLPYVISGVKKLAAARRLRRNHDALWEIDEDYGEGWTQVILVKPGEPNKCIGPAIPDTLSHWEHLEDLEKYRLEAADLRDTLNRPLLLRK